MRPQLLLPLLVPVILSASAYDQPQGWLEIRTSHFVVLSNSTEKQVLHVADQLERVRSLFHKVFPRTQVDPSSPIVVLAVRDKNDFQALEPEADLARGQLDLAGLFLHAPDKNYILLRLDAEGDHPYATVYHEYAHLMESRAEAWLPLWLNEGLAQFYENTEIHEKDVLLGQRNLRAVQALQQKRLIPLATLFTVDRNSPYYHEEDKGSLFYAESWALTHYLSFRDHRENTNRLEEYAELAGKNVDAVIAAIRIFGDLSKLESELQRYIAEGKFPSFHVPVVTGVDGSMLKVEPITDTQADAVRADFLAHTQRVKDARILLGRILHDDPNNVSAHETMGFLAVQDGELEEAEDWYEQAVQLDSHNFLAHYYFAAFAMRAGVGDPERDKRIEASLRTSIKLNPAFAPAYDRLATFYGMQQANLEEAHRLNLLAMEMDPGNVSYRVNASKVLMQMGRLEEAIGVLQNTLKLTTSAKETAMVQSQLESVQRYQSRREESLSVQDSSSGPPGGAEAKPRTEERHGPRRRAKGLLKDVRCPEGAMIVLDLESGGRSLSLRARNYYKIEFSALGFRLKGDLNPCTDLEGRKAQVEFFEALDKTSEGQIISIQLNK